MGLSEGCDSYELLVELVPGDDGHEYPYSPEETLSESPYFSISGAWLLARIFWFGSGENRRDWVLGLNGFDHPIVAAILRSLNRHAVISRIRDHAA
jgi:hypothetical protein